MPWLKKTTDSNKTSLSTNTVKNYSPMGNWERFFYTCLVLIGIFTSVRYAFWWFKPEHIPSNPIFSHLGNFHFLDILLFSILSFVVLFGLLLRIGTWFTVWFIKRPVHIVPQKDLRVAFVTCYVPDKEPISMLEETLVAMRDAYYKHDTWVLDEGNSPEVRELCDKLGVKHFSRKDKPHYNQTTGSFRLKTKAGNLNSWRNEYENDYDIVAQIDMDHVPHKDFLTMTLGYFTDEKVGYVGMPQIYKNNDNWIARGAGEQSHFYYGPLQQGFYGAHMPFLIGTSHLYRVKAMQGFGGYSPNIAEDYLTGMYFLSHGWKGVYVPNVLAEGLGPTTWMDYFNQQMRWSYGLFEILFKHTPTHFFKLSLKQKINITFSQMFYFTGLATFLGVILVSLYLVSGINPTSMNLLEWCAYALPAYISGFAIFLFLHRFYIDPKNEPKIGFLGLFLSQSANLVYTQALFNFLTRQKLVYKVTSKNSDLQNKPGISTFTLHILVFLMSVAVWNISFIMGNDSLVMRFWAFLNIIFLFLTLLTGYWEGFKYSFDIKQNQDEIDSSATSLNYNKYDYVIKNPLKIRILYGIGIISWISTLYGFTFFLNLNPWYWLFFGPVLGILTFHNILNYGINLFYKKFDIKKHEELKRKYWETHDQPSVDVFLPVCGEKLNILRDTFCCVKRLDYQNVNTFVLDDKGEESVKQLAEEFGFKYLSRPNKGEMKKAGNLLYGFKHSKSEFYAVFDADFCPHPDFINDLLPYMNNPKVGLVQSPHYFEIGNYIHRRSPIEYGSANLQEQFFRTIQVARDNFEGAICAGSNTIYRRSALDENGGPAQVDHGEDVNTGLDLINLGYKVKYIPIILAKGLSPDTLQSFYKQQNRWASSSAGLLLSGKIFRSKLTFAQKLCYLSGISYYMSQLAYFLLPLQLFVLLGFHSETINIARSLPFLPYMVFSMILLPLFSRRSLPKFGTYLAIMSSVYVHCYTIILRLFGIPAEWIPTNAISGKIESGFTFLNNFSLTFLTFYFLGVSYLIYRWNLPILNWSYLTLCFWMFWNIVTHATYFWQTHSVIYREKVGFALEGLKHKRHLNLWMSGRFILLLIISTSVIGSFIYSAKVTNNKVFFITRNQIIADEQKTVTNILPNENSQNGSNESKTYTVEATSGDSSIRMIRRIINVYEQDLGETIPVDQRLFMENYLSSTMPKTHIKAGFVIQISQSDLEKALTLSKDPDRIIYSN